MGLNSLRTGTLRASSINNVENYNVNAFSFGGGFGGLFLGGTGQVSTTGGTPLPSSDFGFANFSFSLPSFQTAYGSQSSTTFSAVSPANVVITPSSDGAGGEALSLSALGSLSRDTSSANSALTRQFTDATRASIAQDFEAARQLVTEVSTFFANRAAEQAAKTKAQKDKEDAAICTGGVTDDQGRRVSVDLDGRRFGPDGVTLPANAMLNGTGAATSLLADAAILRGEAAAIGRRNGSGSDLRLIATAISGAAGSNVTGSLGSFVQAAAVNAVQAFATRQAAQWTCNGLVPVT